MQTEQAQVQVQVQNKIQLFTASDGSISLEVSLEQDSVWLSQAQMSDLFGTKRPAITKHLGNIFKSGELEEKAVCSILEHTAQDNKNYKTKFYNLDVIISVGYRVNSLRATQFRQWATKTLKQHLIQGYSLNKKRTGSFLFLWYLQLNQHLLAKPVNQLINDNTLVALALLVAESLPEQKQLMIRLVEHFILLKD